MDKKIVALKIALSVVAFAGTFVLAGAIVHAQTVSGPTIPAGLSATVNQSNQVYISWNPSTETSTPVIGYYLYRNGHEIADTPGYTFYTDDVAAGAYSYTVSAYDGMGNVSAQSAPTSFVTVLADNQPPTQPMGLVAVPSSSSVSLSWDASTDNFGVIGYYIYRNDQMIENTTTISGTTYVDSGLSEGSTYTYTVAAYDATGNVSAQATPATVKTIFDVQPPTAPQGLTVKAVSPDEIDLTWKPSTDNVEVVGYNIYQNGMEIATVSGSSTAYADTGLSPGTSYSFYVYAFDEVDNISIQGPGASATTLPPDTTPPSIPKNFYATPISSSQVMLVWSPSTDNVGVAGYDVYDGTTLIAQTTSTTYTDNNLATSTTYQYFLSAYDAAGNISPQTSLAVTTLSYTPATTLPTIPVVGAPAGTAPPVVAPPANTGSSAGTTPPTGAANDFTANMYYGYRNASVQLLQEFLIQEGDLGSLYATGFYGSLTQAAVKKFQCAENVVCYGSPATTGWGSVGPHTRAVLNSF